MAKRSLSYGQAYVVIGKSPVNLGSMYRAESRPTISFNLRLEKSRRGNGDGPFGHAVVWVFAHEFSRCIRRPQLVEGISELSSIAELMKWILHYSTAKWKEFLFNFQAVYRRCAKIFRFLFWGRRTNLFFAAFVTKNFVCAPEIKYQMTLTWTKRGGARFTIGHVFI